jgi:hypothetical protein
MKQIVSNQLKISKNGHEIKEQRTQKPAFPLISLNRFETD